MLSLVWNQADFQRSSFEEYLVDISSIGCHEISSQLKSKACKSFSKYVSDDV